MITRDDYVEKLKTQLDRWNADISKLEAKAKQPLVGMKDAYEKQLKELRERRHAIEQKIVEIQKSGDQAWDHLRAGADTAWKEMAESFKKAWSVFK